MPLFLAGLVSSGSNGNSIIIAARLHAAAIDEIVYVNWAEPIDVLIGTDLACLFSIVQSTTLAIDSSDFVLFMLVIVIFLAIFIRFHSVSRMDDIGNFTRLKVQRS